MQIPDTTPTPVCVERSMTLNFRKFELSIRVRPGQHVRSNEGIHIHMLYVSVQISAVVSSGLKQEGHRGPLRSVVNIRNRT